MKFLKKGNNIEAFTLAELIIAVLIGTLVLAILMNFIATSMNEITYSNNQTNAIEKINNFSTSINNYKWTFETGRLLIDKAGTWSDVVILTTPEETEWILLWIVDPTNMKLESSEANYGTIYQKYLWVRQLTAADITNLNTDASGVYDLNFNEDKLYRDLIMKDLQVEVYNSGSVLNSSLSILINYKEWIKGEKLDNITNDWIYKINLTF